MERAIEREKRWDLLTQILVSAGILTILIGIVSLVFLGVPEGAVTAASGAVVALIPRLMYGELNKTRQEIQRATESLSGSIAQAQSLRAATSASAYVGRRDMP